MKRHHASIARDQWTAVCAALVFAAILWAFGGGHPRYTHPGASSGDHLIKLWDRHQDLARASVPALTTAASRRSPNSPTRLTVALAAPALLRADWRPTWERRPVTLSPHIAQIRLRAPPPSLA